MDPVTYTELVRAAIDGVLHALDSHSRFESHADRDKAPSSSAAKLAVTGLVLEDVRVAEVRWGPDARDEFLVGNDPDIRAAADYFRRLPELLSGPK